jgi:hypothetical protein
MIILNCEQRSPAWHAARLGIPTASSFSRIVTSQGELSKQAPAYMLQLVAEWATGNPEPGYQSEAMIRGAALEPEALAYYEREMNRTVERVGFVYLDELRLVGGSPDGMGVELKCPSLDVFRRYQEAEQVPTAHLAQIQGLIWLTGARSWDWQAYYRDDEGQMRDAIIITVPRDDGFIEQLESTVDSFIAEMLKQRALLSCALRAPARRRLKARRLTDRQQAMRLRYSTGATVRARR